jgi:hypothetical protein
VGGEASGSIFRFNKNHPRFNMQVHNCDEENSMITDFRLIDILHMYNMKCKIYIIHIQMYHMNI